LVFHSTILTIGRENLRENQIQNVKLLKNQIQKNKNTKNKKNKTSQPHGYPQILVVPFVIFCVLELKKNNESIMVLASSGTATLTASACVA
jgi:hypothetical protein